jgi:hypothetical protein
LPACGLSFHAEDSMAAKKGKKRGAKKAMRVAPACKAKRAAIGKVRGSSAKALSTRGKRLHAFMVCQAEHGIKPKKARKARKTTRKTARKSTRRAARRGRR